MSFRLVSFYYDAGRHLNKMGRLPGASPSGTNKNVVANVYNPVPYTFNFELEVVVKNAEDGPKIIEQIAPWFTPDWTTTIRIMDAPEIIVDIPTILNPIQADDTWEGNFDAIRYITYKLSFKMVGWLYGPSRKDKIIKKAITNVGSTRNGVKSIDVTFETTPGLTANGEPTDSPNDTVPYSDIDWSQDYGFIQVRTL